MEIFIASETVHSNRWRLGKLTDRVARRQAPFHCQFLNDQNQAMCTVQFEYQLAKK